MINTGLFTQSLAGADPATAALSDEGALAGPLSSKPLGRITSSRGDDILDPLRDAEPDLAYKEAALQSAVVSFIDGQLDREGIDHFTIEAFGLDICVFLFGPDRTSLRFFELKVYTGARHGGVGFGDQRGGGPQVDLLIRPHAELVRLHDIVRWIMADATLPAGAPRYAFIDSREAKAIAMGTIARGKQNNFRIADLKGHYLTWQGLCRALHACLAE
jgi:hypothetical protein